MSYRQEIVGVYKLKNGFRQANTDYMQLHTRIHGRFELPLDVISASSYIYYLQHISYKAESPNNHSYDAANVRFKEMKFSPQIFTTFSTLILQFSRQRTYELFEVCVLQRSPYLFVRVRVKWIEVHAQRSREQDRILRIRHENPNTHQQVASLSELWCVFRRNIRNIKLKQ